MIVEFILVTTPLMLINEQYYYGTLSYCSYASKSVVLICVTGRLPENIY